MAQRFGTLPDGRAVQALDLHNDRLRVRILTLGAILNDLRLDGSAHSLAVGFDTLAPYAGDRLYCGAVVGPVANRLGGAQADIDGTRWTFAANEGGNLLHSGPAGLHARIWDVVAQAPDSLTLRCDVAHMDDGFPGNRRFDAIYQLRDAALTLTLRSQTDRPTLANLAPHGYWNLTGGRDLAGHLLQVAADHVTLTGPGKIPAGAPGPVTGGFDLRGGRTLVDSQLDHNFCLGPARVPLRPVASLRAGRVVMTLATTEPGLQVYDGHMQADQPHFGVAMESQVWPDAPNQPGYPSILLRPEDDVLDQITEWSFAHVVD